MKAASPTVVAATRQWPSPAVFPRSREPKTALHFPSVRRGGGGAGIRYLYLNHLTVPNAIGSPVILLFRPSARSAATMSSSP